jgi:hypothetical protein
MTVQIVDPNKPATINFLDGSQQVYARAKAVVDRDGHPAWLTASLGGHEVFTIPISAIKTIVQ